jgi:hypothetical protein
VLGDALLSLHPVSSDVSIVEAELERSGFHHRDIAAEPSQL